ncbi:MAG TPA: hypothetical protein VI300_26930 [Solirubrobacter sp.]
MSPAGPPPRQLALYEAHGRVMKEYVTVPEDLLADTAALAEHFAKSYAYAQQLKPKPTTRKPKPGAA